MGNRLSFNYKQARSNAGGFLAHGMSEHILRGVLMLMQELVDVHLQKAQELYTLPVFFFLHLSWVVGIICGLSGSTFFFRLVRWTVWLFYIMSAYMPFLP